MSKLSLNISRKTKQAGRQVGRYCDDSFKKILTNDCCTQSFNALTIPKSQRSLPNRSFLPNFSHLNKWSKSAKFLCAKVMLWLIDGQTEWGSHILKIMSPMIALPFSVSFSLFSSSQYSFCQWLDLNGGPLELEATALPTEPAPLPLCVHSCLV